MPNIHHNARIDGAAFHGLLPVSYSQQFETYSIDGASAWLSVSLLKGEGREWCA